MCKSHDVIFTYQLLVCCPQEYILEIRCNCRSDVDVIQQHGMSTSIKEEIYHLCEGSNRSPVHITITECHTMFLAQ